MMHFFRTKCKPSTHFFRALCTATAGDGNDVSPEICARQEVICACRGLVASYKTCALQHISDLVRSFSRKVVFVGANCVDY